MLATEAAISIQMTAATVLFVPVMLCVLLDEPFPAVKMMRGLSKGLIFGIALVIYGNIYMTALDLETIWEGRNATYTMTDAVISALERKGYLDANATYMFVGIPSDNPLFEKTRTWEHSNGYSRFGQFFIGSNGSEMSYRGLFREMGLHINIIPTDEYYNMLDLDAVRNMPVFPADESIQKINDYVVVKISNTY